MHVCVCMNMYACECVHICGCMIYFAKRKHILSNFLWDFLFVQLRVFKVHKI